MALKSGAATMGRVAYEIVAPSPVPPASPPDEQPGAQAPLAAVTHGDGGALHPSDFARLKRTSDDRRRLVVSHLSNGEAEDYRPDYFGA